MHEGGWHVTGTSQPDDARPGGWGRSTLRGEHSAGAAPGPLTFYAMCGAAWRGLRPQTGRRGQESSQRGRSILSREETGDGHQHLTGLGRSHPSLTSQLFLFWGILGPCSSQALLLPFLVTTLQALYFAVLTTTAAWAATTRSTDAGGKAQKQQTSYYSRGSRGWKPKVGVSAGSEPAGGSRGRMHALS